MTAVCKRCPDREKTYIRTQDNISWHCRITTDHEYRHIFFTNIQIRLIQFTNKQCTWSLLQRITFHEKSTIKNHAALKSKRINWLRVLWLSCVVNPHTIKSTHNISVYNLMNWTLVCKQNLLNLAQLIRITTYMVSKYKRARNSLNLFTQHWQQQLELPCTMFFTLAFAT